MLIFVSSIGRSGTKYLSRLISHVSKTQGNHVPDPHCKGNVLADYNNFRKNGELLLKRNTIKKNIKDGKYFESSPMFLRSFVDEVFEISKETKIPIGVIHLMRDPLECARSYTNRGSIPGKRGYPFRLSMNVEKNYFKIKEQFLSDYQKNIWDWIENEIRYQDYRSKFDKTYDFYHTDLSNYDKLVDMFSFFSIDINKQKLKKEMLQSRLDKNENRIKTVVSSEDLKEAKKIFSLLKPEDKGIFSQPCYKKFEIFNFLKEQD